MVMSHLSWHFPWVRAGVPVPDQRWECALNKPAASLVLAVQMPDVRAGHGWFIPRCCWFGRGWSRPWLVAMMNAPVRASMNTTREDGSIPG